MEDSVRNKDYIQRLGWVTGHLVIMDLPNLKRLELNAGE